MLAAKETWGSDWTAEARAWKVSNGASISAFQLGSLPEAMLATADAVVLIRALHNLARFEADGGYLSKALKDSFDVLKPGGIAGVVQHHARDDKPDARADGSGGYLKKSFVIGQMQRAGFEFVAGADFNANQKDQPTEADIVWRLPPSLATSRDNSELCASLEAIGESNRMTLKFRKPR